MKLRTNQICYSSSIIKPQWLGQNPRYITTFVMTVPSLLVWFKDLIILV